VLRRAVELLCCFALLLASSSLSCYYSIDAYAAFLLSLLCVLIRWSSARDEAEMKNANLLQRSTAKTKRRGTPSGSYGIVIVQHLRTTTL